VNGAKQRTFLTVYTAEDIQLRTFCPPARIAEVAATLKTMCRGQRAKKRLITLL
jgi:hypothetical protein